MICCASPGTDFRGICGNIALSAAYRLLWNTRDRSGLGFRADSVFMYATRALIQQQTRPKLVEISNSTERGSPNGRRQKRRGRHRQIARLRLVRIIKFNLRKICYILNFSALIKH